MTDYPDRPPEELPEDTPTTDSTRPMTSMEAADLGQTRRQTGTYRPVTDPANTSPIPAARTVPPSASVQSPTPTPGHVRATGQMPAVSPQPHYPPPTDDPYEIRERHGRRVRGPRPKRESGLYLPWWSLLIMLAFVGCAAFGALFAVNQLGGEPPPGGRTPTIVVITATFTAGAPATITPIPQPATLTPTAPLPTIPPTGTLPPGNFQIGTTVQVVGVGIAGLNVRSSPGTTAPISFLAQEGDTFVLKDGPQTASNEEWWQIQDTNNPNRKGWAVRRFLTVAGSQ